ncbi:hypothetical protein Tco_0409691 [Tanacetum coccineum]
MKNPPWLPMVARKGKQRQRRISDDEIRSVEITSQGKGMVMQGSGKWSDIQEKVFNLMLQDINVKRKNIIQEVRSGDVTEKKRGGVSPVGIHPINSSTDEEGGTTVVGCDQNDASIQKEMQSRELLKSVGARSDRSIRRILQVKIPNPKKMLDAAFIPDVGSNGCTTVLDAVCGFVAWPKNQVVLDPKVWICQISQEISQKRTRERMSDQEAKEIKAEAREIMPQPSTVNCS